MSNLARPRNNLGNLFISGNTLELVIFQVRGEHGSGRRCFLSNTDRSCFICTCTQANGSFEI